MPNLRGAYKRVRQNEKRRLYNQAPLTELKNLSRDIEILLHDKKLDEARKKIHSIFVRLDRAAVKGIIPKRRASRKKSRLARRLNHLQPAKP